MALIVPIHGQMSGSIGDNVYSHNKGGPYVRRRAIPVNPSTSRQSAVRNTLSHVSGLWQGLSAEQREAWNAYAVANPKINRLGQTITLSGQAWHNALNARVRDFSGAPMKVPPATPPPASLISATVTNNGTNTLTIAYTPFSLAAGVRLALWATPPGSAGRNPNRNQARCIAYTAPGASSPQLISLPWSLVAGQYINLWVATVDSSGRVTPGLRVRYLIV